MATTNHTIELQAALDKAQSVKNINKDIDKIKKQIKPLEIQVKPEAKSLQSLDGMKKELEELSFNISKTMSGELKKTESSTSDSLSNMVSTLSSFGSTVEKVLKSDSMISGFNSLLDLISTFEDNTKGFFGSLSSFDLGAGLFASLKNIGKSRAGARISMHKLF